MAKRNSKSGKRCATGEKECREDQAAQESKSFDPLGLEIKYPDTAILLLRSPEKPILLAAAAALAKYGCKARGNLELLFDLNAVDNVTGLIQHEDLFTRRFALKLLALMAAVPNVQAHLLKSDFYIAFFTDMLKAEPDNFLIEFSSRILAELTSDPAGAAMFLGKSSEVSFLYERLQTPDADIKRNCIEIIDNLLKDLLGFKTVSGSKDFSSEATYELFNQPYQIIQQLALDVVEHLVMHSSEEELQENFRQSGGVNKLIDLLDYDEWSDLHYKVLRVLNLSCDNARTVDFMNSEGATKRLYNFMVYKVADALRFDVFGILVLLAESDDGKQLLHYLGFIKTLFKYMELSATTASQTLICRALAKMIQYGLASDEIAQGMPVNYVLNLLSNSDAKWPERQTAACTLRQLFLADFQNASNFLEINGQVHLLRLIEQPARDVPFETQVTAVEAMSAIVGYSALARELIGFDLFCALCAPFEPENKANDELKIACCNGFVRFCTHEEARKVLVHARLPKRLYPLICDTQPVPVRSAASYLVLRMSSDPLLGNLCVQEGFLAYMLKNRSASRVIPTWGACIEALFNADLPMKFAYTGRLSLHDVTGDGFYVMRHSSCPFLVLEELFRLKLCPMELIYVANFSEPVCLDPADDFLAEKQHAMDAVRDELRRSSREKGLRVSEATINAWLELKFGRLQTDRTLMGYLDAFKAEMAAYEIKNSDCSADSEIPGLIEVSRIASRARLLAVFVARQLSGPVPTSRSCMKLQMELHLKALKNETENSIIPVGQLRVGSFIERAFLFKVMADRIALPACLVRGRYGKSWVEIAVPLTQKGRLGITNSCDSTDSGHCCVDPDAESKLFPGALPPTFLRENFIVDLMDDPGDLIAIGSVRAKRYYEDDYDNRPTCTYACCCH